MEGVYNTLVGKSKFVVESENMLTFLLAWQRGTGVEAESRREGQLVLLYEAHITFTFLSEGW